jgi:hypothetical protein
MADERVKKDPLRIEATRLAKLKTVAAWRGLVVDQIITAYIVPKLKRKSIPTIDQVLSIARSVFDKQYNIACSSLQNGQKFEIGLLEIETKGFVEQAELDQAWQEVERALINFINHKALLTELLSAEYLVEQRYLWFKVGNLSVQGIPDLIAFSYSRPPIIYDWKVHFYGTISYEQQLLVYALGLAKGKQHRDFAKYTDGKLLEETQLTEVQLINQPSCYCRSYTLTAEKLEQTEMFISDSQLSMYLAGTHRTYAQSRASDYDTTDNPDNCTTCSFYKLCKQA